MFLLLSLGLVANGRFTTKGFPTSKGNWSQNYIIFLVKEYDFDSLNDLP